MPNFTKNKRYELSGFNNLKKALSFSFYDFVIAHSKQEKLSYVKYINERYSAENIEKLLQEMVNIIGANVLSSSLQNYEPHGASALLLLSDIAVGSSSVNMHLDKSHITAHTYPDFESENGVISFRVDIDLSTCGEIIPLKALNSIFNFFDTDIVTIDYVVRGFTRNTTKEQIFIDHKVNSIKDFINSDTLKEYISKELVLENENIWRLKLLRKNMNTDDYFSPKTRLSREKKEELITTLKNEMRSVFMSCSYS